MTTYRDRLPQLDAPLFLTDGGIETTLIFDDGLDLPDFAAFLLLEHEEGRQALRRYFESYLGIAERDGLGIVLETPTWRASPDWTTRHGYDAEGLVRLNRMSVDMLLDMRERHQASGLPVVVSGCVGPRGDGYAPASMMRAEEAAAYHQPQVLAFADAGADLVTAITMTYAEEAVGIARTARAAGMPVVVSFTTETDGRLPDGSSLREAIERVDADTGGYPAYYMVNCAHPTHFADALERGAAWTTRIKGVRANASTLSHAELDEADTLDAGDPRRLASLYRELRDRHPHINVVGGCCGTSHVHVAAISAACLAP